MLEFTAFLLSIIGQICIIYKKWVGWILWFVADIIWVWFNFSNGHIWQGLLFVFYTFVCIWGVYEWKWRKK